jgi:hypothetical protein
MKLDKSTTVKVIAASSHKGMNVTTLELEYPRIIHSEMMTHREFSRNAASSRAIPVKTMINTIRKNMFVPVYWGKNQSGMQAKEELTGVRRFLAKSLWIIGGHINLLGATLLNAVGVHKQLANRNLEYISYMKTIITSTSFDNFLELRDHEDAQPEIQDVAKKLRYALTDVDRGSDDRNKGSNDVYRKELNEGEWHTPYVDSCRTQSGKLLYIVEGKYIDVETAKKVSVSCIAQVSYRNANTSKDKALEIFNKLAISTPIHASPFESVLTPISAFSTAGVTALSISGHRLSGNSKGWSQYRHNL